MSSTTFFSYSRVNSEFVLRLAKDLRQRGAKIWLDQLDIKPGNHWDSSIEQALDGAPNVIIVLSQASVASDNVMDEVSYALENKKRVIPVLLEQCPIPFRLRRLQYIDFTKEYQQALQELLNVLGYNQSEAQEQGQNEEDVVGQKGVSNPAKQASGQANSVTGTEGLPEPKTPAMQERVQPPPTKLQKPQDEVSEGARLAGTKTSTTGNHKPFSLALKIGIPVLIVALVFWLSRKSSSDSKDGGVQKDSTTTVQASDGAAKFSDNVDVNKLAQVLLKYDLDTVFDNHPPFFEGGMLPVLKGEKWGYIDAAGNEVIPPNYVAVSAFSEGLAGVDSSNKWGYIDAKGAEVIPPKFDNAWDFSGGIALVSNEEKEGVYKERFIDKNGGKVLSLSYETPATKFTDGLMPVNSGKKYGYIDKNGDVVIPLQYENAGSFSEGLAWVGSGGKYGYIDRTGNEVIPMQFTGVDRFSEGLAAVADDNNKWGYINKTGTLVIPYRFDEIPSEHVYDPASQFIDGYAVVKLGIKFGVIDKTGKEVIPAEYDGIYYRGYGVFETLKEGKRIFLYKDGSQLASK